MMRRAGGLAFVFTAMVPVALFWAPVARADSKAEAGEAAKLANCTPTKTDVIRYRPGEPGETVYKISCAEDKNVFVDIVCRARSCAVLRAPNEFSIR